MAGLILIFIVEGLPYGETTVFVKIWKKLGTIFSFLMHHGTITPLKLKWTNRVPFRGIVAYLSIISVCL
jgi:hypothetical protein